MRVRGVVVGVLWLAASCTKPNPARQCMDGTCTSRDYPFCDVTGFVTGEPDICVAVSCTPNEFGECRGDNEVRCNASGTSYDVLQCERGCDPAAAGCRLCSPGETACTNGKVATCDESGVVVSSGPCPLGCFEDQPRCREIDPSNGLATYLDMVPAPPDLDLALVSFNTRTGEVMNKIMNTTIAVPNFSVPGQNGGSPVRVFVANNVSITSAYVDGLVNSFEFSGPAFALVARGDIQVTGKLEAHPSAGGVTFPSCRGGTGYISSICSYSASAGGGGGFATNGAKGGDVTTLASGGAPGIASGNEELVPLRGGCAGGGVNDSNGPYLDMDGGGGGAIQLVSRTRIQIDGIVSVVGQWGGGERYDQTSAMVLGGGGSGGAILLEAPIIELGPNAQLLAAGGNGASACNVGGVNCSQAGVGATGNLPATSGSNIACPENGQPTASGGGGGGLGRVRINTKDGTYLKASSVIEDAAVTTGDISTR